MACALALFAASEKATTEEKRVWTDRAVALLERWSQNDDQDRTQMGEDPDLIVLHSDPRFVKLAADPSRVPEQPYWLASREVTRGEYEAFLNDTGYDGQKPKDTKTASLNDTFFPGLDNPVMNVSWYDSVVYCNWLSHREGRTPAYRSAGKKKTWTNAQEVEVDIWVDVDGATGYRLPKEVEWEYACRT